MPDAFVDVNVVIRLLTGDDPTKQRASLQLFKDVEAGSLTLYTPDTTIADAVYVLTSHRNYNLPRPQAAAMLTRLVRLRNFKVQNRGAVLRALDLFSTSKELDFGDVMIAALMERQGVSTVYSYDADFDRLPGIQRKEPGS
jgi:predicted nucleic acid-binding protein